MQPRQFVPPAFVFSLTTTGILAAFSKYVLLIFILITTIYFSVSLMTSVKIGLKSGFKYIAILPIIFFILHASWGLGFIFGIFKFFNYGKKDKHKYQPCSVQTK
jgi:hypothetical protein